MASRAFLWLLYSHLLFFVMFFHSNCEEHFNWLLESTRVLVLWHVTEGMHCMPLGAT